MRSANILYVVLGWCLLPLALSFDAARADPVVHKFMGAASCASSNCHGSVSPRQSTNVLQNEYTTWSKHDRHAQAWLSLTTEAGQTIGKHLGISSPEKEPWCLRCHATYVESAELKHSQFRVEDGVSCESCHGAAEGYLKEHYQSSATHAGNVEQGLLDLVPLGKRAGLCLDCHFGSEKAIVNHRLIGAGHPRLSFELDTFSMLQPRHWKVDEDYKRRKQDYNSARAWLVGQVTLAHATVEALSDPKWSRSGPFPELSLLACYSCHHSLKQEQWKSRDYDGRPGMLRLNTSALFVVEHALRALNSPLTDAIRSETKKIHDHFYDNGIVGSTDGLKSALHKAEDFVESHALENKSLRALLASTAETGARTPHLQYESAEQVAMALSSVLAQLSPDSTLYEKEMKNIYSSLATPSEFVADSFTKACQELMRAVRASNF